MSTNKKQLGTKKPRRRTLKEISAGGIVIKDHKILMIQVKNLKNQIVWTFPKGKLDPGENSRQAAIREVEEETGWRCSILKSLGRSHYFYVRNKRLVAKTVSWFLMKADKKLGTFDPREIRQAQWFSFRQAQRRVIYPLDKKMLKRVSHGI